jgi:hypothetical protein
LLVVGCWGVFAGGLLIIYLFKNKVKFGINGDLQIRKNDQNGV